MKVQSNLADDILLQSPSRPEAMLGEKVERRGLKLKAAEQFDELGVKTC